MSYDFSFNKKTITFLLGGSAFVGIMLFIAGLLLGANWRAEPTAVALFAVNGAQPAAKPAPEASPVPIEPVLKADAAKPDQAAPGEAAAPGVAPSPAKQAHSAAGAESRRESAFPPLGEADANDVRIIQRAEASATEANNLNKMDQSSYSVQVGVFVNRNEANQLVSQLRNKGYTPIVVAASDDESRLWYAVRIGAYANRTEATQAASNITRQEKIKAVVRPLGSL